MVSNTKLAIRLTSTWLDHCAVARHSNGLEIDSCIPCLQEQMAMDGYNYT
jgi:hypothetical protein